MSAEPAIGEGFRNRPWISRFPAHLNEYIREPIRVDEIPNAQDRLDALLMQGLQSREATEMTRNRETNIRTEAFK